MNEECREPPLFTDRSVSPYLQAGPGWGSTEGANRFQSLRIIMVLEVNRHGEVNGSGTPALGFSASSLNSFPSVRYVGRSRVAPRGTMPKGRKPDGDFIMMSGAGSQNTTRWRDYSSMSVDPVNDCTFWYTQQYIGANGQWRTRIGAFGFPLCGLSH